MENRAKALANVEVEIEKTLGAIVKFTEVSSKNGYTTYETQDLNKLTGILSGALIKKAYLSTCVNDAPLKDGTYFWSVDWRFEFAYGRNGNDFMKIWTDENGEIVNKRYDFERRD